MDQNQKIGFMSLFVLSLGMQSAAMAMIESIPNLPSGDPRSSAAATSPAIFIETAGMDRPNHPLEPLTAPDFATVQQGAMGTTRAAYEALKNALLEVETKTPAKAISEVDSQKPFIAAEALILDTLQSIKEHRGLTKEVQRDIASLSPIRISSSGYLLVDDPVMQRFLVFITHKGKDDGIRTVNDDFLRESSLDGQESMVNGKGIKIGVKEFVKTHLTEEALAKAYLVGLAVGQWTLDPSEYSSQTEAAQQIMNLAASPEIFKYLKYIPNRKDLPSYVSEPKANLDSRAFATMIQQGANRTNWYKDSTEPLEEIMRHTLLAVIFGSERYYQMISSPIPTREGLTQQLKDIRDGQGLAAKHNSKDKHLQPGIPLNTLAGYNMEDLMKLKANLTRIDKANEGAVTFGAMLATLGGLWYGGTLGRQNKRFSVATQRLEMCDGPCKPISLHTFKKQSEEPQEMEQRFNITTNISYLNMTNTTYGIVTNPAKERHWLQMGPPEDDMWM